MKQTTKLYNKNQRMASFGFNLCAGRAAKPNRISAAAFFFEIGRLGRQNKNFALQRIVIDFRKEGVMMARVSWNKAFYGVTVHFSGLCAKNDGIVEDLSVDLSMAYDVPYEFVESLFVYLHSNEVDMDAVWEAESKRRIPDEE
ncbi:MAG: hypothetical protein WC505_07290 [Patescibacteria group bacterium]